MKKKRVIKELLTNIVRISHRHPEGSVEGDAYHLWLIGCGGQSESDTKHRSFSVPLLFTLLSE